jgi:hypothetical protein
MIIWGLIFVTKQKPETFTSDDCQNTLIKDGNTIFLYNSRKSTVPGINPIKLKNLEEYREYISWQRANNINCPILHLEKVFDTQGSEMYEIKSSFNTDSGTGPLNHSLPAVVSTPNLGRIINAETDDPPYNQNMCPSYDQYNQNIGIANVIDYALT